jgi:hypothetical protein
LTGSAETSEEMISKLKDLALSDALSVPTLAAAAQKMTALGFSSEQTFAVLQSAANAAAATGNDVGAVANAIDRMALSGTAAARQLATLGISTQQLGDAMGVSATEATKAFKALDQSDRIDALNAALQKYNGVAAQVAQGVSGQFQNMKTQVEFVMESIGQALAPVALKLVGFVNDLLPSIESIVAGFASLPEPAQEVVIALTAAVPVVATLAIAFGTFGTQLAAALPLILPVAEGIAAIAAAIALVHFSGITTDFMDMVHAIESNWAGIVDLFSGFSAIIQPVKDAFSSLGTILAPLAPIVTGLENAFAGLKLTLGDVISAFAGLLSPLKMALQAITDLAQYLGGNYKSMADAAIAATQKITGASDALNQSLAAQAGALDKSTASQMAAINANVSAAPAASAAATATTAHATALNNATTAATAFVGPINQVNFGIETYNGATLTATTQTASFVNGVEVLSGTAMPQLTGAVQTVTTMVYNLGNAWQTAASLAKTAAQSMVTAANSVSAASIGPIQAAGQAATGGREFGGSGITSSSLAPGAGDTGVTAPLGGGGFSITPNAGSVMGQTSFGATDWIQTIPTLISASGKFQDAANATTTAAAALTTAAATQQDAAQTAYDAAKAATIAANNTTNAAESIITANDSISASMLNAATLSSDAIVGAGAILSQAGTNVAAAATTLTSASTSLAGSALALNTAVKAATVPASSTFTPFAPVVGQLPNVGPNGGMTGGLNPAVYTPGYQSNVTPTVMNNNNTINAGVVVGANGMADLARMVGDQVIRNLQGQGIIVRRS